MADTPRILAFSGSLREGSFNQRLVRIAAGGARSAGAEVTELDLRDLPLPVYSGDLEAAEGLPDNARKLKDLMKTHDGFLIGSPENNSSVSAALKNTIDWASRREGDEPPLVCFKGKTAAIMSASPGGTGGLRGLPQLRYILSNIGVLVLPDQKSIPNAGDAFDDGGSLKDPKQQEAVEQIGGKLASILARLKGGAVAAVCFCALLGGAGCTHFPGQATTAPATAPATRPDDGGPAMARRIEAAQGMTAWRAAEAVSGRIYVDLGGSPMLDAVMVYDHHRGRVRMELAAGPVLVFDGERTWVSPATAQVQMARFQLLTWPYFLAAPFKLRDPGARLEATGLRPLDGVDYQTALLTFEAGTGDSPDDWYVIYEDPESHRLAAMAYIVTYGGKSVEEAEQEPHVIVYRDFQAVDGATLSARWTIHNWSDELGAHGPPLAEVTVRDLRFVTPDDGAFAAPAGAREDSQPGG